jgi:hypothetical protein
MRIRSRWLALAAAPLLAAFMAAAPAAHASAPIPRAPTLACQITTPGCVEPVAALAFPSTDNYIPVDDAALTVSGNHTYLDPDNEQGDGSQDFTFALIAHVPHPGHGPGAYGFTGFDRFNYGGDGVYLIEWTPFGQDTGWCLQDTGGLSHYVQLRMCDGGADQAWIIERYGLPLVGFHTPYVHALSVLQTLNAQHHLCLTGHLFGQTTDSRCVNKNYNSTNTQEWAAIPGIIRI